MNVRTRIFRCAGNQKVAVSPGFPVELVGVGKVHAAFVNESRTRGPVQRSVQEIRVAPLPRNCPDFLLVLLALAGSMRLSLMKSRTRGGVQWARQETRVLPARCTFFAEHRAVASRTT